MLPEEEADDITNPVADGPKNAATGVVIMEPAVALADNGRCKGPVAAAAAAAEASSGRDGSVTGGSIEGAAAAKNEERHEVLRANYTLVVSNSFRLTSLQTRKIAGIKLISFFPRADLPRTRMVAERRLEVDEKFTRIQFPSAVRGIAS